jgi:hypothetical protein
VDPIAAYCSVDFDFEEASLDPNAILVLSMRDGGLLEREAGVEGRRTLHAERADDPAGWHKARSPCLPGCTVVCARRLSQRRPSSNLDLPWDCRSTRVLSAGEQAPRPAACAIYWHWGEVICHDGAARITTPLGAEQNHRSGSGMTLP